MKTFAAIASALLALQGCASDGEHEPSGEPLESMVTCDSLLSQRHYTPGQGSTADFVSDSKPEAIHCDDHSCRGDMSGLVPHSGASPADAHIDATTGNNLWAITDKRTKDRTVDGESYNNSKWLFQIQPESEGSNLGMKVTRIHNLRENESGAWNMHDPEALVRRGNQLGVIDAGNSWRDVPAGNVYEAGYCLQFTHDGATHRCTILSWTQSSSTYTSQTTEESCTAAGGVWLPEPPNVQGRINPNNAKLKPYGYMRFTEPAVDTNPTTVEASYHQATAFVRFRFPATCSVGGDDRPCGQWADLGLPGTAGHFNVEAAAVTAGDYLVLITKGPKRPAVSATTDCSGGFFTEYNTVSRRVDDGDTHVFYLTTFSTRASAGAEDVSGCSCPNGSLPTDDWRHCTGCAIDATSSPVLATFVTRFNLHEPPYSLPFITSRKDRVTDASAYGDGLYFNTKTSAFRVYVGSSAPTASVFSRSPCTIRLPTTLTSADTACTDASYWCHPELESMAVFAPNRIMFGGEEGKSASSDVHNWIVRHDF